MFGASFSVEYADELGLDWRQAYQAILQDLGVKHLRLMSYWEQIEPAPGQFDFADLDWQMEQARLAGAKVSLAIGLRQPRWPECHYAPWARGLGPNEQKQALESFISAVVKHYRNDSAIESYQLENEALLRTFGACQGTFDRGRLQAELDLVRGLDPAHPVAMSVSNQYGLPLGSPRPDEYGFSIYKRAYVSAVHLYFNYRVPAWFYHWRAAVTERLTSKPVFVHELQAEPWGPGATVGLSIEEQNKTMDAGKLTEIIDYSRGMHISHQDLWGAEWWYWRKVKFHDDSLWQVAKSAF